MTTLIDTNIIFDLLNEGEAFTEWSEKQVHSARKSGQLFINQIVYVEASPAFSSLEEMDIALPVPDFVRENLPWEAAKIVGDAFIKYRRQGGEKRSLLPDFYIGAHATVKGHRVLTRDPKLYRSYFPSLEVIAPDTHP